MFYHSYKPDIACPHCGAAEIDWSPAQGRPGASLKARLAKILTPGALARPGMPGGQYTGKCRKCGKETLTWVN
jgi:hypothetical protein